MNRRIFLLLLSFTTLSAWTHGGGQVPGTNVVDDNGVLVVDDSAVQVVTS
jgi:hypothetical protein